MTSVFIKGLLTGLLLQVAVGPVFFFIANLTLQGDLHRGLFAVAGVTLADYIYIALAAAGAGRLAAFSRMKREFTILGAAVLAVFGAFIIYGASGGPGAAAGMAYDSCFGSFTAAFFLTMSSPLTVVFWTGLFAAKTAELGLSRKELVVFALSAGLATALFLGLSVVLISHFRSVIPDFLVRILNYAVGAVLIGYGILRIYRTAGTAPGMERQG